MPNLLRRSRTRSLSRRCMGCAPPRRPNYALLNAEVAHFFFEMTAIHSENRRDWESGAEATREARAQRQRRQDRLEEIRTALQRIYGREKKRRIAANELTVLPS